MHKCSCCDEMISFGDMCLDCKSINRECSVSGGFELDDGTCDLCYCEVEDEDEFFELECSYCGGDHSSFLCPITVRFDDMDCIKCGSENFLTDGRCAECNFKQY